MEFAFTDNYVLENDKILLRPLALADFGNLQDFSLHEPGLWTHSLQTAAGLANLEQYILLAIKGRQWEKEYPFIVYDKRSSQYAGCTRFYDINLLFKTLLLGFTWYGKDFQRTHINRNCKYLLLEFAFEKMKMERVEFRADAQNEKSIAAMKAIGCKEEGILRSNVPKPDCGRRDSIVMSVLKEEWFCEVKERLGGMIL
jgi:N-acetyltransferase